MRSVEEIKKEFYEFTNNKEWDMDKCWLWVIKKLNESTCTGIDQKIFDDFGLFATEIQNEELLNKFMIPYKKLMDYMQANPVENRVMPKIAELKLPTDTELDWIDEVKTMSCTPKHYFIRGAIYMREKVLQQLNK
jgi:hypothetical protein